LYVHTWLRVQAYNAQCNSGACGYSGIGGVTLNTALSTTDCSIKVGKPLCDARPDKKSTMWVVCPSEFRYPWWHTRPDLCVIQT
jgi:hypothetical protein